MAISEGNHIVGREARGVPQRVEAGNGVVEPTAPSDVERCVFDRGDTHLAEIDKLVGMKPHVVGAEPARTSGVRKVGYRHGSTLAVRTPRNCSQIAMCG